MTERTTQTIRETVEQLLNQHPHLKRLAKHKRLVLGTMYAFQERSPGEPKLCFVGAELIARICTMNERHARRVQKALRAEGFLFTKLVPPKTPLPGGLAPRTLRIYRVTLFNFARGPKDELRLEALRAWELEGRLERENEAEEQEACEEAEGSDTRASAPEGARAVGGQIPGQEPGWMSTGKYPGESPRTKRNTGVPSPSPASDPPSSSFSAGETDESPGGDHSRRDQGARRADVRTRAEGASKGAHAAGHATGGAPSSARPARSSSTSSSSREGAPASTASTSSDTSAPSSWRAYAPDRDAEAEAREVVRVALRVLRYWREHTPRSKAPQDFGPRDVELVSALLTRPAGRWSEHDLCRCVDGALVSTKGESNAARYTAGWIFYSHARAMGFLNLGVSPDAVAARKRREKKSGAPVVSGPESAQAGRTTTVAPNSHYSSKEQYSTNRAGLESLGRSLGVEPEGGAP